MLCRYALFLLVNRLPKAFHGLLVEDLCLSDDGRYLSTSISNLPSIQVHTILRCRRWSSGWSTSWRLFHSMWSAAALANTALPSNRSSTQSSGESRTISRSATQVQPVVSLLKPQLHVRTQEPCSTNPRCLVGRQAPNETLSVVWPSHLERIDRPTF